jgi:hypothetical protein
LIDIGQLLTRGTIWLAILAYAVGTALFCFASSRSKWLAAARAAWTTGCIALLAHFICAFHFYHHWSQLSAYSDTARQTNEVVGLNWGGGLFINYAVLSGWIIDVGWWWLKGIDSYRSRGRLVVLLWHAFLLFIIFNATVVFKNGIVRWVGLAVCACIAISWIVLMRQRWIAREPPVVSR